MRTLSVVVAVVALSGCSLAFQEHRPDGGLRTSLERANCSSSRKLPWIDVGVMAGEVALAGVGEMVHDGTFGTPHEKTGTVIAGVALGAAVLQLASAGNGFRRAEGCRATDSTVSAAR